MKSEMLHGWSRLNWLQMVVIFCYLWLVVMTFFYPLLLGKHADSFSDPISLTSLVRVKLGLGLTTCPSGESDYEPASFVLPGCPASVGFFVFLAEVR
jgi:hypothetical protein